MKTVWAAFTAAFLVITLLSSAQAQNAPDPKAAFEEARKASTTGPADIALAEQATLKLPAGHSFVPQPQATKLLNAMGNPGHDDSLQGLIFPQSDAGWFMTVRFEKSGYVKDDDAREWKADELLKTYREGTEASNEERVKMGVPAMEIVGWAQAPQYDASSHRLVWAMSSRDKGAPAGEPQGVNFNTYVLGREGYFMMNLVTGLNELPAHKPAAQTLLAALSFAEGKRYEDFNAATDHVAEYGLAALVLGVGAKKVGLLAALGLFFAKFAKVILVGLALVGGGLFKLFKRNKSA